MGMDPKGVKLSPNGRFLCKANSSLCFKPLSFGVGRYTSTDYGKYHRPVILLYFCVRRTTFASIQKIYGGERAGLVPWESGSDRIGPFLSDPRCS